MANITNKLNKYDIDFINQQIFQYKEQPDKFLK